MTVEIGIMLDLDGICGAPLDQAYRCVGVTYNVTRLAQPSCLKRGGDRRLAAHCRLQAPLSPSTRLRPSHAQISHYKATAAVQLETAVNNLSRNLFSLVRRVYATPILTREIARRRASKSVRSPVAPPRVVRSRRMSSISRATMRPLVLSYGRFPALRLTLTTSSRRAPARASSRPFRIVLIASPVARAAAATPPWPIASASAPAQSRRARSSSVAFNRRHF
jgi:hypothetical protein